MEVKNSGLTELHPKPNKRRLQPVQVLHISEMLRKFSTSTLKLENELT